MHEDLEKRLAELIEQARNLPPPTEEEKREQSASWVVWPDGSHTPIRARHARATGRATEALPARRQVQTMSRSAKFHSNCRAYREREQLFQAGCVWGAAVVAWALAMQEATRKACAECKTPVDCEHGFASYKGELFCTTSCMDRKWP